MTTNSPPHPAETYAAAVAHHAAGRLAEAERLYRQLLAIDAGHAGATHMLGVLAHQVGRNEIAVALIGKAISLNATDANYFYNLGTAHRGLGQLDKAIAAYRQAIVVRPDYAEAYGNLGISLFDLGKFDEAMVAYQAALRINPGSSKIHANLGNLQKATGRIGEALSSYAEAIRLDPNNARAHANLGAALHEVERFDDAIVACRAAIAANPNYVQAYINLGSVFTKTKQLDLAIEAFNSAIRIDAKCLAAYSNLGKALNDAGRTEEAIAACKAALAIDPQFDHAYAVLGKTQNDAGHLDLALAAYEAAIRLKPGAAEVHFNSAVAHLLGGNFEAGWKAYEWRLQGGAKGVKARHFKVPKWAGEDIAGRTLLLHSEQGLGDTIQFCRYAALVAARGARVILEAPRHMLRLLGGLPGVDQLVAAGDALPPFDLYCPLMSLPGLFHTRPDNIPQAIPYLQAEEAARSHWAQQLGTSGFKIGIIWQGNPVAAAERGRSAPLSAFAALARMPGVRLISLQKVHGLEQLESLPPGMQVETLGPEFDAGPHAFIDTAAIMMHLDLIVTVDTAAGHLAGALGRPVWLALQEVPHWVWMQGRSDSPWYPSTRLFRQRRRGEWEGVFFDMASALAAR